MSENDVINKPSHYISDSGLETIDVIDAFTANLKGTDAVYTANAIKYICRWPNKNGIEDLKKARWYIDRLIKKHEKDNPIEETCRYATEVNFVTPDLYSYQPSTGFIDAMSKCCSCKIGYDTNEQE